MTPFAQEYYAPYWTNTGSSIPPNSSFTGTDLPSLKPSKIRLTRDARHCWRRKNELISDSLLWTPSHGQPTRTYLQQVCTDTWCCLKDLLEAIDDRDESREWVRKIRDVYIYIVTYDRYNICSSDSRCGRIRRLHLYIPQQGERAQRYDIRLYLIERFQSWILENVENSFIAITPRW